MPYRDMAQLESLIPASYVPEVRYPVGARNPDNCFLSDERQLH